MEFSGARASQSSLPSGPVGELVDGIPARVWMVAHPNTDSLHSETLITGHVSDRVRLGSRLTLDAGLALDIVSGSAVGAANGIDWQTLLPHVSLRWLAREGGGMAVFAGYGRSAYRLPLDVLAIGDPAAPRADLFRWDAPAGAEPPLTALGPLVARVGPGTGGDNTFSAIDTDLKRPYTDEVVVGLEAHPRHDLTLRLLGMTRRERNGIGLVNTGVPLSAYSVIGVPDIGINVQDPADDGVVSVYNRLPASFGRDRYLLTNPSQDDSTSESFEVTVQWTTKHALFFIGGTASQTDGPAANRGYGPLENDEGIVGELFTNPNAEGYARGRLFNDRAFTGKIVSVFHLPKDFRLGLLVRYQDGQPFSRLIVMPGLNQGAEAGAGLRKWWLTVHLHWNAGRAPSEEFSRGAISRKRHPRRVQPAQHEQRSRGRRRHGRRLPHGDRCPTIAGYTHRAAPDVLVDCSRYFYSSEARTSSSVSTPRACVRTSLCWQSMW